MLNNFGAISCPFSDIGPFSIAPRSISALINFWYQRKSNNKCWSNSWKSDKYRERYRKEAVHECTKPMKKKIF